MTMSDDVLLDPKNWSSIAINRSLRSLQQQPYKPDAPTAPANTILPLADDPSSVTEPESEPDAPMATMTPRLDRHCMFATPSPPPPGSIYWKYFMREEDAKFYDCAGTDESFHAVRQKKKELQALLDK
ncbi:uncharacterized protein EDB91DRAFT_1254662 [Suillus paluster]|uniref:uncharacterized protein n=1 Tax=Suillus paluster TaxID=48578 RepID=UPI001B85C4A0|nr:uncharacterized protein EDB91DRAFT_1254662 [Suillus paluster]KAG1725614.1 hypothetical protein EDB91DRAFT_1254662 [Suillus paluster]